MFAGLSEVPYRLFMADASVLNVMPTLLLGLVIAQGWQQRNPTTRVMALVALLLTAIFQKYLMFGFAGVLLPLVFVLVLEKRLWYALFPAVFCLAGNAWPQMFAGASWGDPISIGSIVACVLAPVLGIALLRAKPGFAVIPMRRWAYAIYPLHFCCCWACGECWAGFDREDAERPHTLLVPPRGNAVRDALRHTGFCEVRWMGVGSGHLFAPRRVTLMRPK